MFGDSVFIVFIGILVTDIVYQSGIITKIYQKISKLERKIEKLEDSVK